MSTTGTTSLAPEGLESGAPPQGVIELSDDELEGLIASFAAVSNAGPSDNGPSASWVTTLPDTSGDWEFARRLSTELNREEIPGDRELAWKLFVELNREALKTLGDRALVDLVSDYKDVEEGDACEGEDAAAPGDKEEEGTAAIDGPPEQAVVPPSPPPSA